MDIQRDKDVDLNNVYAWNYNLLKFMGIWPEERKWNRSSSYLVLLPFITMMCFACGPQTINLSIIAGDSDLVIENLSNNITFMVSIMKTLTVWINGIPLKSLLGYMANDWEAVTNNTDRETMVNTARITRKITIGSTLMVNIVILAFVPARLSSMKNNDITLFLRGYYPYNTSISPNFELTMIAQYVAAIYAANTYTTVDSLVVLLIFHVCGQISILRQDLEKVHSYDKKNIEIKMQQIVEKHEYINRFAGRIENSFNMMLLFQMLSCTIQICSQFYQVIMSLGENTMEHMILQISFLLIYVAYVMLQLFLYCYMGEKLAAESTEIANTAYNTRWYNLPPKNARWLVIIMCRARSSPLQITAGRFCSFTFALYCQVLKTSMGYVSVLHAMKNQ
ncbi:odorant receptor 4-like [Bombus pascuorum]|uniref:odorant receptor 4-like n=1 Tax=Bombus pascuorum TaxID=65598 RepID=UPI00298E2EA7|nr:odorant receptor 4-like [Bombus pascuorum]